MVFKVGPSQQLGSVDVIVALMIALKTFWVECCKIKTQWLIHIQKENNSKQQRNQTQSLTSKLQFTKVSLDSLRFVLNIKNKKFSGILKRKATILQLFMGFLLVGFANHSLGF